MVESDAASALAAARRRIEELEQRLAGAERIAALTEEGPHPAVIHADGVIRWVNQAAAALTGIDRAALVGRNLYDFVAAESQPLAADRISRLLAEGEPLDEAETVLRVAGRRMVIETRAARIMWEGRPAVHLVFWDVTARCERSERLAWDASHDPLTGLLNRAGILRVLNGLLASDTGAWSVVGVALVDLDGFKAVNDTFGHAEGDRVLTDMGHLLAETCPDKAVGRLGGDEFLVVWAGAGSGPDPLGVTDACRQIVDEVQLTVAGAGTEACHVRVSVGCATGEPGRVSTSLLLAQADRSMYLAKQREACARRVP